MKLFGPLYDRVRVWSADPRAPFYLGALSVAEAIFFPIPPDVMLAPMTLAKPERWWQYALLTTVASVVGGVVGYLIGVYGFDALLPLLQKLGWDSGVQHVTDLYRQHGLVIILLAGFTPIPYKLFTIASGAAGMAFAPFALGSLVSRGARFMLVAGLVAWGGPRLEPRIRAWIEMIGWAVIAGVLVGLGWWLWR